MTALDASSSSPSRNQTTQDRALLCLLLTPVIAFGFYGYATTTPAPEAESPETTTESATLRINPNTAEWWELTVLPGIGEVTAKRIIDYRETRRRESGLPDDAPVFLSAADLQRVKGIGPKRSEQAAPHLVFLNKPQE